VPNGNEPVDQLHHEHVPGGGLLEAVDLGDVRVIQERERLRLASEARETIGVEGKGRGQELERHLAIQASVTDAVHFAHSADAEW
jgi:hypothetical protein